MADKTPIRSRMRAVLAAISPQDRHQRSLAVCQRLAETRQFREANVIMLFISMDNEVETSTLALRAWKENKAVAVPRVHWEERRIEPVEISSLQTTPNRVVPGLRDPTQGTVVPLACIDLVAVPGLAFDRRGYRVGRGKGFYDRFLAHHDFRGLRIAACFHEQILVEPVPIEAHDVPMDMIVTDREIVLCTHRRATIGNRET